MKYFCAICLIASFLIGAPWVPNAHSADEMWAYSLTPYVWLPSFTATLKYSVPPGNDASPEVETDTSYLNKLNAAFMLTGNARKGDLSFYSDFLYIDVSGSDSHVTSLDFAGSFVNTFIDAGTQTTIKGLAWTLGGGYTVLRTPDSHLDVIGGLRYLGVDLTTDWRLSATVIAPPGSIDFPASGRISEGVDLFNALIGVRGRMGLFDGGKWGVPYYFDVGLNTSMRTWQGVVGLDYTCNWGELLLLYRHLSYGQGSDKFIQNLSLSGPMLGATFRF